MTCKGYTAAIKVDEGSGLLFGHAVGLRDGITFQGETIAALKASFAESVDFYVELCASRGKVPEVPFSGKLMVRIDPALHRAIEAEATARGVDPNDLIEQALSAAFPERPAAPAVAKPKTAPRPATVPR